MAWANNLTDFYQREKDRPISGKLELFAEFIFTAIFFENEPIKFFL